MQETHIRSSPKAPFSYKNSSEIISDEFLRFILLLQAR